MNQKFIAEQEILVWWSKSEQKRVTIRLSEPRLEQDEEGDKQWVCYPKLDGLVDIENGAIGLSSFLALYEAITGVRQILRDHTKGARIYLIDEFEEKGNQLYPDDGMTLKELFNWVW